MTNANNTPAIEHIPAANFDPAIVAARAIIATMADGLNGLSISAISPLTDITFKEDGGQRTWHPLLTFSEDGKVTCLSMDIESAEKLADEFDRLSRLDAIRHSSFCDRYCHMCRDGLRSAVGQIREYLAVAAVLQPSQNVMPFRPRATDSGL